MHSVFAQDLRLKGDEACDDPMNPHYPVVLFGGVCPVCRTETEGNSAIDASHCECEGVSWRLNLTVTTEDLPPFASSISEVRARVLQAIAAAAAVRRTGKVFREMMADLVEKFGRKAVDDAVSARQTQPGLAANVAGGRAPEEAAHVERAEPASSVVEVPAPPNRWHGGQRPLTLPNLRRAATHPLGFDRQGNSKWGCTCPTCHDYFVIKTDTLRGTCRCENVTWRMNVAIATHDFPPHAWHPETVRKHALRGLYASDYWNRCEIAARLFTKLEEEFEAGALFCSIIEV